MKGTLTEKILKKHLESGKLVPGQEISIKIDQTLTQDATGTMAYLEFLNFDLPKISTKLSVSYVDHNTLQTGFENADDHLFLQSVAEKFGIYFSKPGNGICHQVHSERFAKPGETLIGSDSHTPTAGGVGMLAIGVGGLEVASALASYPYSLTCPEVIGIKLKGKLPAWSSAKDIILTVLKKYTVKGGVNRVFEYFGDGVKSLSVPERATITNMGAELGATTSIFPSDINTQKFLKAFGRARDYKAFAPDKKAQYKEVFEIDLKKVEPLLAMPHSPDAVTAVKDVKGMKVGQVIIGSCTNSSYKDLMTAALALKGKKVHKDVSFIVAPGSRTILNAMIQNGALSYFIEAGARVVESACGPCIGMGHAPASNSVSMRTFNRNFKGRSGTADASIILSSVETAVAAAVFGEVTDPKKLGKAPVVNPLIKFEIDNSLLLKPLSPAEAKKINIIMGPNIKPLPVGRPVSDNLAGKALIKLGDNITTDDIMPAGAKILPLRSNTPEISKYVFMKIDPGFYSRSVKENGGFIIGGDNYGQGSSREHAALAPMHLGVKAVITKSFARIHKANLINFGLLPLNFTNPKDYDKINAGDRLELVDVANCLKAGKNILMKVNGQLEIKLFTQLSDREKDIILDGGKINYIRYKMGVKRPLPLPATPTPVVQQPGPQQQPAPQQYRPQQPNAPQQYRPQQYKPQQHNRPQQNNTPQQYRPQQPNMPQQYRPQQPNTPQQYRPQQNNAPQQQYKPQPPSAAQQPNPQQQQPVQQPKPQQPHAAQQTQPAQQPKPQKSVTVKSKTPKKKTKK
jgi:aconitate hydratase